MFIQYKPHNLCEIGVADGWKNDFSYEKYKRLFDMESSIDYFVRAQ